METVINIFSYFWIKFLVTIPIGIFIVREQHFTVIYGLLMMIFIDSILGICVSIKYKTFSSHKLRKIAKKTSVYFLVLWSVWILECVAPFSFGWLVKFFGVFLIMTELFSNFEKLALLDVAISTKLLSKINKNFHNFYFGKNGNKEKALTNILDKKNNE